MTARLAAGAPPPCRPVGEVAVAVGQGRSNAESAAVLYLSVATVKTQVSRILVKFGYDNRVQIALLVHDAGLLDDESGSRPA